MFKWSHGEGEKGIGRQFKARFEADSALSQRPPLTLVQNSGNSNRRHPRKLRKRNLVLTILPVHVAFTKRATSMGIDGQDGKIKIRTDEIR